MTEIPQEAIEAVARTHWEHGQGGIWDAPPDYEGMTAVPDESEKAEYRAYASVLLRAARPHLIPTEAETKALAETATKLGVKLGRAEALKEIADEMGLSHAWQLDDPRINYVDVQIDKETYRQVMAAKEEGR